MKKKEIKNIVLSSMFLAIGIVLPFITGQIPEIGVMLCPMHIPVFLCGMIIGWKYGLVIGLITPILRSVMFGLPPLFPSAVTMSLELGTYGLTSGLIIKFLFNSDKKNILKVLITLIISMIIGRIVYGICMFLIYLKDGSIYTFKLLITMTIINSWPGIIIQIILIPLLLHFIPLEDSNCSEYKK